jgi:NTP pyrophosphatase (non-canonical NTP hydrolase)
MTLREIQEEHFKVSTQKGYTENWNKAGKMGDLAELGLIVTEISEAMEEIRKHKINKNNLSEECADIIIRTMNFMSRKGLDLDIALWLKNNKNKNRKWLHGKAI